MGKRTRKHTFSRIIAQHYMLIMHLVSLFDLFISLISITLLDLIHLQKHLQNAGLVKPT